MGNFVGKCKNRWFLRYEKIGVKRGVKLHKIDRRFKGTEINNKNDKCVASTDVIGN